MAKQDAAPWLHIFYQLISRTVDGRIWGPIRQKAGDIRQVLQLEVSENSRRETGKVLQVPC